MEKKTVVVLFGGQSSEHEVSCVSAKTIMDNIDTDAYKILPVGITKEGQWLLYEGALSEIKADEWVNQSKPAYILPDATKKALMVIEEGKHQFIPIDVVFPVLHGMFGEDGTVQGLLEMARIPYVGCGVLSSSIAMDKVYTKAIVDRLNIRQAKSVSVYKEELFDRDKVVAKVLEELEFPVFIKPANAGSSVGVTKAKSKMELIDGLEAAIKFDRKLIVEETIVGRELECAVLGGHMVKASGVGEIIAAEEFYSYDAKYNNTDSKTVLSPELPEGTENKIRDYAVDIFKALDGYGLARVDFFLEENTDEIVFNEINTMPGFTSISMYPMLWENKGMPKAQLIDRLIQLAFKRFS